ncbi:hypothetical protein BDW62DRAFT_171664 [Aspergillus aurantiobrunneus]
MFRGSLIHPLQLFFLSLPFSSSRLFSQFIQSSEHLPSGWFFCLENSHLHHLRDFLGLFRVYLESPSASDRAPQPGTSGSPIACCAHRGRLQKLPTLSPTPL